MSARTSALVLERRVAKVRGRRSHQFRANGTAAVLELGDAVVLAEFFRLIGGAPGPSALSARARAHLAACEPSWRPDVEALLIEDAAGRLAAWLDTPKEEPHAKQA